MNSNSSGYFQSWQRCSSLSRQPTVLISHSVKQYVRSWLCYSISHFHLPPPATSFLFCFVEFMSVLHTAEQLVKSFSSVASLRLTDVSTLLKTKKKNLICCSLVRSIMRHIPRKPCCEQTPHCCDKLVFFYYSKMKPGLHLVPQLDNGASEGRNCVAADQRAFWSWLPPLGVVVYMFSV